MIFNEADMEIFRRPHVGPCFFLEIEFPDGTQRYHNGVGNALVGGFEWAGVTDAFGERAVMVQEVDYPEFGTAPAITIPLFGCDAAFMAYMRANDKLIEGRAAKLYIAVIDPETMDVAIPLRMIFTGQITGVRPVWEGIGTRTIILIIESIWQAKNFGYNGIWSNAGQQRKWPGDKGGQFIGVPVTEFWK